MKAQSYLDRIASVAVIISSAATLLFLAHLFFRPAAAKREPTLQIGQILQTSAYNPDKKPRLIVIAMQVGCHFCTDSAPEFRKLLASSSKNGKVAFAAVLPNELVASKEYVSKLGLNMAVYHGTLDGLQVRGTPTVIELNDQGKVLATWVGALNDERVDTIIAAIAK